MSSVEAMRKSLLARLDELEGRQRRLEGHLRRLRDPDSEERAQEAENDEVLEDLDNHGRDEIALVRHALGRIELGTYGVCEICNGKIPVKRLEAFPAARLCINCKAEQEKLRRS